MKRSWQMAAIAIFTRTGRGQNSSRATGRRGAKSRPLPPTSRSIYSRPARPHARSAVRLIASRLVAVGTVGSCHRQRVGSVRRRRDSGADGCPCAGIVETRKRRADHGGCHAGPDRTDRRGRWPSGVLLAGHRPENGAGLPASAWSRRRVLLRSRFREGPRAVRRRRPALRCRSKSTSSRLGAFEWIRSWRIRLKRNWHGSRKRPRRWPTHLRS